MKIIRSILGSGLTRRLIAWFLILALVPLLAGGLLSYLTSRSALQTEVFDELQAVGAGRRDAIELLLEVRLEQIQQIATKSLVHDAVHHPTPEGMDALVAELRQVQQVAPAG